jgi:hypothetical protein
MMSNGLGFSAVRGTGTNGFSHKSLSFARNHKDSKVITNFSSIFYRLFVDNNQAQILKVYG